MLRVLSILLTLVLAVAAAERTFDFSQTKENQLPQGFRSTLSGEGKPGDWKVLMDDDVSAMPSLTGRSPEIAKKYVLAQVSQDKTDEHFPLLVYDGEEYGDFTMKTRLKTVEGKTEQMAGVAFRIKDEKNYYVVRISSLGHNIRFYKFLDGVRSRAIETPVTVSNKVWHDLTVECKGNQITVQLNGKTVIGPYLDPSFSAGKIGFWTKSDSVSYFSTPFISYTPRVKFATSLVEATIKEYSKLLGLRLYAIPPGKTNLEVVASKPASEVGQPGDENVRQCFTTGSPFIGKGKGSVTIMMPIRDRNGDIVAVAKVTSDTFLGQTEDNALVRTRPVIRFMEQRVMAANEPLL